MSPEWNLASRAGQQRVSSWAYPLAVLAFAAVDMDSLEEFPIRIEDDDGDVGRAQNSQLVRLLEEAVLPFQERDLAVPLVLDRGDRDLAATHGVAGGAARNASGESDGCGGGGVQDCRSVRSGGRWGRSSRIRVLCRRLLRPCRARALP